MSLRRWLLGADCAAATRQFYISGSKIVEEAGQARLCSSHESSLFASILHYATWVSIACRAEM